MTQMVDMPRAAEQERNKAVEEIASLKQEVAQLGEFRGSPIEDMNYLIQVVEERRMRPKVALREAREIHAKVMRCAI